MATIHCFLRERNGDLDNPLDAILYGPSTQNKIERWWRELHERMERFFKEQLKSLVESGDYDSSDQNDRYDNCMHFMHSSVGIAQFILLKFL
jgi:hypothetical protein